jgi:hypothetical protein
VIEPPSRVRRAGWLSALPLERSQTTENVDRRADWN